MTTLPTLTDGSITLRPWREADLAEAIAGHDEQIAHWSGRTEASEDAYRAILDKCDRAWELDRSRAAFALESPAGQQGEQSSVVGFFFIHRTDPGTVDISWALHRDHRGRGHATRGLRVVGDWALTPEDQGGLGVGRIEARVEPENEAALRVPTRAGLRREGIARLAPGTGERADTTEKVVFARLSTDPPLSDPMAFRSLLNSFLPRKRAIAQMFVRDEAGRVLLCRLTYKQDWDLPGGVVEVGESPREAVGREVFEELGLHIEPGELLLTDWLPPWSGWDDALCLVFDGGRHDAGLLDSAVLQAKEIREVAFCTIEEIHERAADFTARRIEAILAGRSGFTESGR